MEEVSVEEGFIVKLPTNTLTPEQIEEILDLFREYKDVFALTDDELGECTAVMHTIPLSDETPIKMRPYRIPKALEKECQDEILKMLRLGVIEPSSSPFTSPVVMVPKKDGSIRFCIDYRNLNTNTIKDTQPLPAIDDLLQKLAGSKYFSTMDLKSGYWQIMMKEEDRH